jgi:hypothetical protein
MTLPPRGRRRKLTMNRTELRTLIESVTSLTSFFETQVLTPIPWTFKGEAPHFQDLGIWT